MKRRMMPASNVGIKTHHKHNLQSDDTTIEWCQCDNQDCERWFHKVYLDEIENPVLEPWLCPICSKNSLN